MFVHLSFPSSLRVFVLAVLPFVAACSSLSDEDPPPFVEEPVLSRSEQDTLNLPATNYYELTVTGVQGRMVLRLYDETPMHRDNFKKLVRDDFYDGTIFHRVIEQFMIQGGDPNSQDTDPTNDGTGGPGYRLPAEFASNRYHRRGALAAAREGDEVNPQRHSSGSQFYIVQGLKLDSLTLNQVEQEIRVATSNPNFNFSTDARQVYSTEGGAPWLDQQYTVFGEVVEGLDMLDRLAAVSTPRKSGQQAPAVLFDRPHTDLPMTLKPLPEYEAGTAGF